MVNEIEIKNFPRSLLYVNISGFRTTFSWFLKTSMMEPLIIQQCAKMWGPKLWNLMHGFEVYPYMKAVQISQSALRDQERHSKAETWRNWKLLESLRSNVRYTSGPAISWELTVVSWSMYLRVRTSGRSVFMICPVILIDMPSTEHYVSGTLHTVSQSIAAVRRHLVTF